MGNNEAEFNALKQGLEIARRGRFQKLVMEGDSTLVINIMKKLQQGTHWEKISKSWRTTRLVQEIGILVKGITYLISTHVPRLRNAAGDFLSNWVCGNMGNNLYISGNETN